MPTKASRWESAAHALRSVGEITADAEQQEVVGTGNGKGGSNRSEMEGGAAWVWSLRRGLDSR